MTRVFLSLQVNLFFLLNIIRVLVTKLRDTHRAESNMYMKAVRATLILVPLLGIQFVIIPWRPENRLAGEVYEYIMHILMHYQVGTTGGVSLRHFSVTLAAFQVRCGAGLLDPPLVNLLRHGPKRSTNKLASG